MEEYNRAQKIIEEYNQEHLLKNYDRLTEKNKQILIKQILEIDFNKIQKLVEASIARPAHEKGSIKSKKDIIEPISYIDKDKLSEVELEEYKKIGVGEIKKGKYAVITIAGGQRN